MNLVKLAQRQRQRRAAAWADRVYRYIAGGGENTPRILEILEGAKKRRDLKNA